MGTQFCCTNSKRRSRVLEYNVTAPTPILGIDYVEVIDRADLGSSAGTADVQRLLLVVGVADWPTPLTAANFTLTGGVRTNPKIVRVDRLATWTTAPTEYSASLAAYLTGLAAGADAGKMIAVLLSGPGDFATYTLSMVVAGTATPLYDVVLSSVELSFKLYCAAPVDCAPEVVCAPESAASPTIDYLARDYSSFRQLMVDRIAVLRPTWDESSPADLTITIVEILAYVADYLSYYQDAAATEAYLHSARRRVSVRRHARLLDYPMHDGCTARGWVEVQSDTGGTLPAGTRLCTRVPGFETVLADGAAGETFEKALLLNPQVFETLGPLTVAPHRASITLHTWADELCCLPVGATTATVRFLTADIASLEGSPLSVGDVLVLEEVRSPDSPDGEDAAADADKTRRHAVRLTAVAASSDGLYADYTILEIAWHADDALPFAARIGEEATPNYVFRGNIVLVTHGYLQEAESLDPVVVPTGRYRPRLTEINLSFCEPYSDEDARTASASASVTQDVTAAQPWVTLSEDDGESVFSWTPVADLLSSDSSSREFVVETEDDGNAWLRFGDGTSGRAPSPGSTLTATYRTGNGLAGNVGAEAIAHVVDSTGGLSWITAIRNPLAAKGGVDPELLADVRRFAPVAFRSQRRAVTEADYETLLEARVDIQKAKAKKRWTGSWHTMYITIDPAGTGEVDEAFQEEILGYLEPYRMMGMDLEVRPPVYVGLYIQMSVCVDDGYVQGDVLAALLRCFSATDNADGSRGFFHPDNFTFGEPLYWSRLVATAMGVTGVCQVYTQSSRAHPVHFRRWASSRSALTAGVVKVADDEVLRCDNDSTNPEYGVISFNLVGGR